MTATTTGSRMALTIDTQDEGVRIAAAALKDMREGNPPVDPTDSVMASFATSRHERSHPSHSPTRLSQPATPSLLSIASSATSNSFDTPQLIGVDRSTTPNSAYSQSPSTSLRPASESSPPEFLAPASPQDVYLRRLPFVNTALKSYDYAKNNSRVVKFGAEMVESSVKTISKPVINRLPGAVTNRLGYTRADSDKEDKDRDRDSDSASRPTSPRRLGPEEDRMDAERSGPMSPTAECESNGPGPNTNGTGIQRQLVGRSAWQTMLVEASGISAAVSDESMRKMRYCLQCLQYATENLDNQIRILQAFIASVDATVTGDPIPANAMVSPEALRQYAEVKKNVIDTIRQVVDVIGKYAGGVLPEPAKATVKNLILALPGRWSSAVREAGAGLGEEWAGNDSQVDGDPTTVGGSRTNPRKRGHGTLSESSASISSKISAGSSSASVAAGFGSSGLGRMTSMPNGVSAEASGSVNGRALHGANRKQILPPTAGSARTAAHRVLTLATESLHAVRGVTGVFKETLDRAEAWLERFRYVGYRSGDPVAALPAVSSSMTLPPIAATSPLDRRRGHSDLHLDAFAKSTPIAGLYGPYGATPPASPVPSTASDQPSAGGTSYSTRSATGRDSFPFDNPAPGWLSRGGSVPAGLYTPNTRNGTVRRSGSVLSLLQSPTGEGSLPPPSTPGSIAGDKEEEDEDSQDLGLEYRARKRRKLRTVKTETGDDG